jgi:DNA-directed RNA polymerase subunit RPC12/RpoP
MGMLCIYRCESCGWEFSTWGPREFFRDASGNRHAYGHPFPCSPEAERQGIHGLDAQLYCLVCGKTSEVVLNEFAGPIRDPIRAWQTPESPEKPRCPHCGQQRLVASLPDDERVPCPRCGRGRMVLAGGGIS